MSILTEKEREDVYRYWLKSTTLTDEDGLIQITERAVLERLAGMELPEPETFEAWNAKQHGDPEEIGFLQALRIAYCSGQDSVNQRQAYAQGAASQLSAEPVGYFYHDAKSAEIADPMLHSTLFVHRTERRESCRNETPLFRLKQTK